MDARALLEANLELIERVIRFTTRRQRLDESESEEFASIVKLKLVENDYAVMRKFQGRCHLATFITIVVRRMLLDYRIHHWGKWHASAEAKRLGDLAVELEQLLHRDGRTLDEALPMLVGRYPEVTRESLEKLDEQLPERRARRRMVDLTEADDVPIETSTDENVLQAERRKASQRLSNAMRDALAGLDPHDRLLLQLRFEGRLTVAQIARSMHIEQKLLYRRMEKLLRDLRAELERAGIDPREVADLIGREGTQLDFVLGTAVLRPSTISEGSVATRGEVSP
jgi:RNA polymerase sigma factor (sigma-70 family)